METGVGSIHENAEKSIHGVDSRQNEMQVDSRVDSRRMEVSQSVTNSNREGGGQPQPLGLMETCAQPYTYRVFENWIHLWSKSAVDALEAL